MKHLALLAALPVAVLSMQGCATKDYGRQSSLTGYERDSMSCQEIDQEIGKVVVFVNRVNSGGDQHEGAFAAALEDHWIGNSLEKSAALESANNRMVQLWTLRDAKKCGTPASTEAQAFPLEKSKVEERF